MKELLTFHLFVLVKYWTCRADHLLYGKKNDKIHFVGYTIC